MPIYGTQIRRPKVHKYSDLENFLIGFGLSMKQVPRVIMFIKDLKERQATRKEGTRQFNVSAGLRGREVAVSEEQAGLDREKFTAGQEETRLARKTAGEQMAGYGRQAGSLIRGMAKRGIVSPGRAGELTEQARAGMKTPEDAQTFISDLQDQTNKAMSQLAFLEKVPVDQRKNVEMAMGLSEHVGAAAGGDYLASKYPKSAKNVEALTEEDRFKAYTDIYETLMKQRNIYDKPTYSSEEAARIAADVSGYTRPVKLPGILSWPGMTPSKKGKPAEEKRQAPQVPEAAETETPGQQADIGPEDTPAQIAQKILAFKGGQISPEELKTLEQNLHKVYPDKAVAVMAILRKQ